MKNVIMHYKMTSKFMRIMAFIVKNNTMYYYYCAPQNLKEVYDFLQCHSVRRIAISYKTTYMISIIISLRCAKQN